MEGTRSDRRKLPHGLRLIQGGVHDEPFVCIWCGYRNDTLNMLQLHWSVTPGCRESQLALDEQPPRKALYSPRHIPQLSDDREFQ